LKDVNGKFWSKIAIVGPSGTGKSTIASLLRFDIDSGEILIDGKIFMISENLHWQYEYSSQDVILFGGTIKENIAYGKPDATGKSFSCKTS
jgi:ABC-type multidrug transport system fused ATPase/permease subunit